jgi:hypothetical protein
LLVSPISKEARALAFPWLACLAAMILPALFDSPRELAGISVPAYFIAMAALGALSIGHEYTGRTVSLLLSLPVQRKHLLAIKLLVLAVMLLALWFVGDTVVFGDARLPQTISVVGAGIRRPFPGALADDGVPERGWRRSIYVRDRGNAVHRRRTARHAPVR